MSLTARFAAELSDLAAAPLDEAAREACVALVTDGLAVAALGAGEAGPRLLAEAALATQSKPVATLIGHATGTSAAEAARANGAAMHVLDFEPMWNPANHALSTTLPALLALAEAEGGSAPARESRPLGGRVLAALAIGIEAQARLRLSSGQFEPRDLVFHPPGVVGPIGSAVASGVFLGLDRGQLTHAIGIAASRAGAILANVGSMTKALHCGQACAAGLESALLARKGFTADANALAGPRGFVQAFFGDRFDPGELLGTGGPLHVVAPGPAFKLYPSQYGTHFVIDAALAARAKLSEDAAPDKVRIVGPPMPYVDRPHPASGLAGKFSFQYTACIAILDGTVDVDSFTDARRFAPDVVDLLPKIVIEPDTDREGRFDRMVVDVAIELQGGARVDGRSDGPPGIWGRPAGAARLRDKALGCFAAAQGAERGRRALDIAQSAGELDHPRLAALMATLRARAERSHESAA
jgi:aconitate decarboxylase